MTRYIGPAFSTEDTLAFVAHARSMLGVRFRHQGRSVRGVDCAGLVQVCLTAVGRPVLDLEAYGREPLGGRLEAVVLENFGDPIALSEARVGDVVLMRFQNEPQHLAILGDYLYGGLSVIHSYLTVRKVVEHRLDEVWRSYITGVHRP